MIRTIAFSLAFAALPYASAAQSNAADAADAAEAVATKASGAFEQIDPDSDVTYREDATVTYAGAPPITGRDAPRLIPAPVMDADIQRDAPRAPAVRMIANEVVQPLPMAAPKPVPAMAPVPAAIASTDPFVIRSILPIEGSIRYGDWFWDESAAPAAGTLVITVDLEARVISAFRGGHEIGTAVALLGTQAHPTPLGSFPILTKEKDNISEKYNDAPMPHTLRLTWDGIAIHGSPVMNGYASHGCIGVPDEFAAKLFAAASRGDRVIITRGKMIGVGDKVM